LDFVNIVVSPHGLRNEIGFSLDRFGEFPRDQIDMTKMGHVALGDNSR